MKALLLTLLATLLARGDALVLQGPIQQIDAVPYMQMTVEGNTALTPEAVRASRDLSPVTVSNLGYGTQTYWTRLVITNDQPRAVSLVLANPRASVDRLDLFLFKNGVQTGVYRIGEDRPMENRSYNGLLNNIALELDAAESVTVVTRVVSTAAIEVGWQLYAPEAFMREEGISLAVLGIFGGAIAVLIIYNLILFAYARRPFYLYFVFYLIFGSIFQSTCHGGWYYLMSPWMPPELNNPVGFITVAMHTLFWNLLTLSFFDLANRSPRWGMFFRFNVYLAVAHVGLFSLGYVDRAFLDWAPYSSMLVIFVITPLSFVFTGWIVYKNYFGSYYFALAMLSTKITYVLFLLNIMGKNNDTFSLHYGPLFGMLLGAFFLSLALASWLRKVQREAEALRERVEEQKKYAMINSTISFIAHQWRQPLSRMGSILTDLHFNMANRPDQLLGSEIESVKRLDHALEFVNRTITDIQNLFRSQSEHSELFDAADAVREAIGQSRDELLSYHVTVEETLASGCHLRGDRRLLKQALFNLIQNAVQAMNATGVREPVIQVRLGCDANETVLEVEDNGGGVRLSPAESIFELHVTERYNGSGLGLPIVKQIVEIKFGGTISVKNEASGARFTMRLPH